MAQVADRTVDDALALLSPASAISSPKWMRRVKTQLQAMLEPDSAASVEDAEEFAEFPGELVR